MYIAARLEVVAVRLVVFQNNYEGWGGGFFAQDVFTKSREVFGFQLLEFGGIFQVLCAPRTC